LVKAVAKNKEARTSRGRRRVIDATGLSLLEKKNGVRLKELAEY